MSEVPASASAPTTQAASVASTPVVEAAQPANTATKKVVEESDGPEGEEVSAESIEATPAEEQKIQKLIRKIKGKVDGKDFEEEIDLNDESKLVELMQLAKMSRKRADETVQERKKREAFEKQTQTQMQALVQALKDNPEAILSHPDIGHNTKELAQKMLAKQLAEEAKSPEVRELEAARAELEKLRKENQQKEETRKTEEQQRRFNEELERYSTGIQSAMEQQKLPNNPATFSRVVELIETAEKHNLKASITDIVKLAKEEINQDVQKLLSELSEDQLEEFLGENVVKTIKKNTLKRKKEVPNVDLASVVKPTEATDSKPTKKLSLKDFMRS